MLDTRLVGVEVVSRDDGDVQILFGLNSDPANAGCNVSYCSVRDRNVWTFSESLGQLFFKACKAVFGLNGLTEASQLTDSSLHPQSVLGLPQPLI